jgi:Polyketide cyclase / dehydrase and lipid transport
VRILRLFIISFVLLFLLVSAISLFVPSRVRISKAINVKASPAAAWQQIDDMGKWKQWNPFFANVPAELISGMDTSQGRLNAMTVNGTTIRWIQREPGERIAAMERVGRQPVQNGWKCMEIPGADSTTIQWYMDFNLKWYPWEKLGSLLFEKSYGPKMEQGLTNLKKILEADRISH